MGEPLRLTPEMSSRKLQALDFIKRYFAQWGHSPTLGELAAALDVSTKRAHDLIHQLARDEMIEHLPGKTRGIRLRERGAELSEADVLVRLAGMGWTVAQEDSEGRVRVIMPPADPELQKALARALMEKELHELPMLDHDSDEGQAEGLHAGSGQGAARRNCARG